MLRLKPTRIELKDVDEEFTNVNQNKAGAQNSPNRRRGQGTRETSPRQYETPPAQAGGGRQGGRM